MALQGLYGFERRLVLRDRRGRQPEAVLETEMVPAFEHFVYKPIARGALAVGPARRLQSGRLSAYLLYLLAVVVAIFGLIRTIY